MHFHSRRRHRIHSGLRPEVHDGGHGLSISSLSQAPVRDTPRAPADTCVHPPGDWAVGHPSLRARPRPSLHEFPGTDRAVRAELRCQGQAAPIESRADTGCCSCGHARLRRSRRHPPPPFGLQRRCAATEPCPRCDPGRSVGSLRRRCAWPGGSQAGWSGTKSSYTSAWPAACVKGTRTSCSTPRGPSRVSFSSGRSRRSSRVPVQHLRGVWPETHHRGNADVGLDGMPRSPCDGRHAGRQSPPAPAPLAVGPAQGVKGESKVVQVASTRWQA